MTDFNRTIRLSVAIRREMAAAVHRAWRAAHPRPTLPTLPDAEALRALDAWRLEQEAVERRALSVLATFATVNQLAELWPAALAFVPDYLLDPAEHFTLPAPA